MKSDPFSTNVVSRQNAIACSRVLASMIRGPVWLAASPQVTTATTPETCSISAGTKQAKGVTTLIAFCSELS
jgi:hypothetical protein